jgi:hypothetical protein
VFTLLLALTLAGRCATFVTAAHAPATVREAPSGAPVRTLASGVELHVDGDRAGWLHISAPARGWIDVSATTVYCGSSSLDNQSAVMAALDKLGARAQTDRLAADMLMRYWVFGAADGYAGETAKDELATLMKGNPKLFASVADQLPPAKRAEALRTLSFSAASPRP